MTRLDRFLAADWESGVIRAEAGLSLDALLRVSVPRGWFIPVTPGTKLVTLGGAVANDVHGKNHEVAGTIGCHVLRIGLVRSTGEKLELSAEQNAALFAATVGGLGLTGVMLWVELQLMPVRSAYFEIETLEIPDVDAFFRLSQESRDWPYTVAWIDMLARGRALGRGLFMRGRHAGTGRLAVHRGPRWNAITVPLLNAQTVRLFNIWYRLGRRGRRLSTVHYDAFLYPLDAISDWSRFYGARGFFQHQSVIPMERAPDGVRELLRLTAESGEAPFLTVLKVFGDRQSPGLLSFPMPGATLALDLPNKGESTRRLLTRLTNAVIDAGGRIYPAKDATMSPQAFRAGYPAWRKFAEHRDPAIMSDFWRRVAGDAA